jgi:hypothetical protein
MTQALPNSFLIPQRRAVLDQISVDYIIIGGQKSPGKCTIKSYSLEWGIDARQAYGLDSATLVPTGRKPAKLELEFYLWDPADFPAWWIFSKQFFSRPALLVPKGLASLALSIQHPAVNNPPINVKSVMVEATTGMLPDGEGGWSSTISFIEFLKPRPTLPKPPAAIPSAASPKPTAQDASDREIQSLKAQLQGL